MTFPQSTLYGHLGVRSSTQFAAMAAANFPAQTVLVDDGSTSLKEYRSDGVSWAPSLTYSQALGAQALVSKDGTTGVWRQLPASGVTMRVRLTGAGTVSMDSATGDLGAGTVTTAVYAATVAGTQIDDYAYPGDAARSIRFTLTGTAAVEVY